jgi:hypothetical protein
MDDRRCDRLMNTQITHVRAWLETAQPSITARHHANRPRPASTRPTSAPGEEAA